MQKDLIIEIGTEELPPMSLTKMSIAVMEKIKGQLENKKAEFVNIKPYATPRRLAVLIEQLNIDVKLIPEMVIKSFSDLPGKKMRWGNVEHLFVRPVHWLVVLFGEEVINVTLFGVNSSNITYGHRFLAPAAISLHNAVEYENILAQQGKVIVDFNKRKQLIIDDIHNKEQALNVKCILDENLLEEVTAITEYPVALIAEFSKDFLNLPKECLISAMGHHQRSFALASHDNHNQLLSKFLLISNMPIKNVNNIIQGNQRVMHARLQDAAFLYSQDLKINLIDGLNKLKIIVLHEQLGNVYQQVIRIQKSANSIAKLLNISLQQQDHLNRAALLCKADLVSQMVLEFAELQGIMGYYYALQQHESTDVALAIKEHYLPRFAEDILPESMLGVCLALAYRLDLLFGLFAIGKAPTGEKDPFALRRHALAVIRILIDKKLFVSLSSLFNIVAESYSETLEIPNNLDSNLINFCLDRLKNWYLNRNVVNKVFQAVLKKSNDNLYDIDLRVRAIIDSNIMQEAQSLLNANKRVNNILEKTDQKLIINKEIDRNLLKNSEELKLFEQLISVQDIVEPLLQQNNYNLILQNLLKLKPYLDQFFEKVMVMVEDENVKINRLILLSKLKKLFSVVADLSLLI